MKMLNAVEKFTKNDLIGLDRLQYAVELAYLDPKLVGEVYESMIWSLAGCSSLDIAQNKLEHVIALLESYVDLNYFIERLGEGSDFIEEISEINPEYLEKTVQILHEGDDTGYPYRLLR